MRDEADCEMADVGSSKGSRIKMNGAREEERDSLASMDGARTRKMTDWEAPGPQRQRKISHRKVIIHDDGEICNRTYNKAWSVISGLTTLASKNVAANTNRNCMIEI